METRKDQLKASGSDQQQVSTCRDSTTNLEFMRVSTNMPARSDVYAEAKRQLGLKVK